MLDELQTYENDFSDALCPIQRDAETSLLGEHNSIAPASNEAVLMMHNSLSSDIRALQSGMATMSQAVVQLSSFVALTGSGKPFLPHFSRA